jgi:hypothetical protein
MFPLKWQRAVGLAVSLFVLVPVVATAFALQASGFALRIRQDVNPHAVFAFFALPGERVPLSVVPSEGAIGTFAFEASTGTLKSEGPAAWTWTAPAQEGLHPLRVVQEGTGRTMVLNAFVMRRLAPETEIVRGYRIGRYPERPLNGRPIYRAPRGVVEVTEANRNVRISPHFTLGQFVCKQGTAWPKYVVLREPLLLKLEALLAAANAHGWEAETFHVMSGYRTPAYNRGLGNVGFSRHMYGDAADVFVDRDGDGNLDDLNRDGKVDRADAEALQALFAEIEKTPVVAPYLGGLGIYPATAAHGPFVHVDARGFRARWGE